MQPAAFRPRCADLADASLSTRAVAFYYPWYGNPEIDGRYSNWNHPVAVRNEPPRSFPGGEDIGANFYPALGCYSSNDPKTIQRHMAQLSQAGVGVLCVSWWGKDTYSDRALPRLFVAAEKAGLKINFHIEPFPGRNARTTRDAMVYLVEKFGRSPACHRLADHSNRPVFFVYDSYLTPAKEWAEVLTPAGASTVRGTSNDAVVFGVWVKEREEDFMKTGGFDGFYTYFATDGFTFGSTTSNWPRLATWAKENGKLFVPCWLPVISIPASALGTASTRAAGSVAPTTIACGLPQSVLSPLSLESPRSTSGMRARRSSQPCRSEFPASHTWITSRCRRITTWREPHIGSVSSGQNEGAARISLFMAPELFAGPP